MALRHWSRCPLGAAVRGHVDLPVHRLHGVQQRRLQPRRLRRAQPDDVLADVRRPQLHQLRRLPDGPERHAQRAAVARHRATPSNWGVAMSRHHRHHTRPSARSRGGAPGSPAPGRAARRLHREGRVVDRDRHLRGLAGPATSTGARSTRTGRAGRRASSTSSTSSRRAGSPPRRRRASTARRGRRRPARVPRPLRAGRATQSLQWLADGRADRRGDAPRPTRRPPPTSARRSRCAAPAPASGYTRRVATSQPTAPVAAGVALAGSPSPSINGAPEVGEVLTVVPGEWSPGAGARSIYRWRADGVWLGAATQRARR